MIQQHSSDIFLKNSVPIKPKFVPQIYFFTQPQKQIKQEDPCIKPASWLLELYFPIKTEYMFISFLYLFGYIVIFLADWISMQPNTSIVTVTQLIDLYKV